MSNPDPADGAVVPAIEPLSPERGRYGWQNLCVLGAQAAAWGALLAVVSAAAVPWPARGAAVVLFCLVMQGVFSLMHEHFHRNAHRHPALNYAIGFCGSLLFGTSATLHRVNHWGHHLRNRSPSERGDFIHCGESRRRKISVYYAAQLGGLWLAGVLIPVASLLIPYRAVGFLSRTRLFNTYAAAFPEFHPRDWTAMRLEALALAGFWGALLRWGPWSGGAIALCYGAFAVSWSSLQWVYHLRTPLHPVEGAYNLRAPWLVRMLFLNFNYNLTHHRRPALAWQELPAQTDLRESQPLWHRWIRIPLQPPAPYPDDPAALARTLAKTYF